MRTNNGTLHALTICINYSDYLEEILRNQIHFDRWTIITCRSDTSTKRICKKHGLEVLESRHAGWDGSSFDSAFAKAPVLNEGLELVEKDAWALVLDADVLLPRHFRQRLDGLELYPRALYGMYARRGCETWEEYEWRRGLEPWTQDLGWHPNILGYFQLFRNSQPYNKYLLRKVVAEMHDDIAFQYQFMPQLRRFLPMTCLHVGVPQTNWGGRLTETFRLQHFAADSAKVPHQSTCAAPEVLEELERVDLLVVVGMDPTTPIARYAQKARSVHVIDWHGIRQSSFTQIEAQDRRVRCRLWEDVKDDLPNVHELLDISEQGIAKFFNLHAVNCVVFDIELRSEEIGFWGQMLRTQVLRDVYIVGRFYGFPKWRETTFCIGVTFGQPDRVLSDGSWIVKWRGAESVKHPKRAVRKRLEGLSLDQAVIYFALSRDSDLELLVRWLCGKLSSWQGDIVVLDCIHSRHLQFLGQVCSVRILICPPIEARDSMGQLSAEAFTTMLGEASGRFIFLDLATATEEDIREAIDWKGRDPLMHVSEFWNGEADANYVELLAETAKLTGDATSIARKTISPKTFRMFCGRTENVGFAIWRKCAALAAESNLQHSVQIGLIATYQRLSQTWTFRHVPTSRPVWDMDGAEVRAIAARLAPAIAMPKDTLFATAVVEADIDAFATCLASWRFHKRIAFVIFTNASRLSEFPKDSFGRRWRIVSENGGNGLPDLPELSSAATFALLEWRLVYVLAYDGFLEQSVAFIPPFVYPAPGARLFEDSNGVLDLDMEVVATKGSGRNRAHKGRFQPHPNAPMLVSKKLLMDFAAARGKVIQLKNWRAELLDFSVCSKYSVRLREPFAMGWRSV